jgi:hypothetical protein
MHYSGLLNSYLLIGANMKIKTGIKSGYGMGDAVAEITHLTGMDRLASMYEQVTGNSCGCEQRKEMLNQIQLPSLRQQNL